RRWATVGSYNVNNVSAYASVELNVDVQNELFASAVEDALDRIIDQDCELFFVRSLSVDRLPLHFLFSTGSSRPVSLVPNARTTSERAASLSQPANRP